jgi:hypothetical protein
LTGLRRGGCIAIGRRVGFDECVDRSHVDKMCPMAGIYKSLDALLLRSYQDVVQSARGGGSCDRGGVGEAVSEIVWRAAKVIHGKSRCRPLMTRW